MKREIHDMSFVREEHIAIHNRLLNWQKWSRDHGRSAAVHPMFREYRNAYDEPQGGGIPCDTLDAIKVQKAYTQLPEKQRWVLLWWYTRPYIPVMRVRQALGLTTPALYDLVHDSRSMMKNTIGAC